MIASISDSGWSYVVHKTAKLLDASTSHQLSIICNHINIVFTLAMDGMHNNDGPQAFCLARDFSADVLSYKIKIN